MPGNKARKCRETWRDASKCFVLLISGPGSDQDKNTNILSLVHIQYHSILCSLHLDNLPVTPNTNNEESFAVVVLLVVGATEARYFTCINGTGNSGEKAISNSVLQLSQLAWPSPGYLVAINYLHSAPPSHRHLRTLSHHSCDVIFLIFRYSFEFCGVAMFTFQASCRLLQLKMGARSWIWKLGVPMR